MNIDFLLENLDEFNGKLTRIISVDKLYNLSNYDNSDDDSDIDNRGENDISVFKKSILKLSYEYYEWD